MKNMKENSMLDMDSHDFYLTGQATKALGIDTYFCGPLL